ncbi:MAG: hypothetical protein EP329_00220 [Deltaproteobacteria bacterium]|nr:MAG: hypothetical protein EP329_00220 [Deltaproteobacteria bacterium]
MLRALVILVATSPLACADSVTTAPIRPVTVAIQPSDLHSNVDATQVFVIVGRVGPAVALAESEAIVDAIELVTPSGDRTPILTERVDDYSASDSSRDFTAFRLTNLALADGWNSVRVALPAGTVAAGGAAGEQRVIQGPTGTTLEARLNPSSSPTLRSVLVCGKGDIHKVIVDFSEAVAYNPDSAQASEQLAVSLNGASCDALRLTVEPTTDPTATEADFACAPVEGHGEIAVTLGTGLTSATGVRAFATTERVSTRLVVTVDLDRVAETCVPLPIP